jgi:hypothetical protein
MQYKTEPNKIPWQESMAGVRHKYFYAQQVKESLRVRLRRHSAGS